MPQGARNGLAVGKVLGEGAPSSKGEKGSVEVAKAITGLDGAGTRCFCPEAVRISLGIGSQAKQAPGDALRARSLAAHHRGPHPGLGSALAPLERDHTPGLGGPRVGCGGAGPQGRAQAGAFPRGRPGLRSGRTPFPGTVLGQERGWGRPCRLQPGGTYLDGAGKPSRGGRTYPSVHIWRGFMGRERFLVILWPQESQERALD